MRGAGPKPGREEGTATLIPRARPLQRILGNSQLYRRSPQPATASPCPAEVSRSSAAAISLFLLGAVLLLLIATRRRGRKKGERRRRPETLTSSRCPLPGLRPHPASPPPPPAAALCAAAAAPAPNGRTELTRAESQTGPHARQPGAGSSRPPRGLGSGAALDGGRRRRGARGYVMVPP